MIDKEIVQALRCCKFGVPCEKCPVVGNKDCFEEVNTAAADLIERLTAENAALREKVEMLMRDRVTPALANVAGRTEEMAHGAADAVQPLLGRQHGH